MLTDDLGSVRTAITNQAGTATVAGYMGYGPFGFLQYHAGQMGTNKGYTGQYNDPLSGLDYYVARYYDPVVGLFLSADTVQSNLKGFDPYAYVGNNPETLTDPTGHWGWGAAAITVGLIAGGIVLASIIGIISAPLLVAIAGGVLTAFAVSTVVGAFNGSFTSDSSFDDWGYRTLIAEAIGGASAGFSYGLGAAAQTFAEQTNISTWPGQDPQTDLTAAQSASANQGGQAIGNTVAGIVGVGVNYSKIHAPGHGSGNQPHSPNPKPGTTSSPSPSSNSLGSGNPIYKPPMQNHRQPTPPTSGGGRQSTPSVPNGRYYTVVSGDTLWGIASRFYGSGLMWQRIYQNNLGVIGGNPNLIYPGERLAIR